MAEAVDLLHDPEFRRQVDECRKVKASFEYFLDNYVQIEDKERKCAIKLSLWPAQRSVLPELTNNPLTMILKARQLGLTWLVAAYVLWRGMTNALHLSVIISVSEALAIEFLDRIYFILDRLPAWMIPPIKTRSKQTLEFSTPMPDKTEMLSTIKSLATTEMGAQSKTPNILVMDETCMSRMAKSIFNASLPGIEQAKGQVIVISNSIKTGPGWGWTRDLYQASMFGINKFRRIFLSWRAHPGRSDTFREDMKSSGMAEAEVAEHYPETEEEALSERYIKGAYYAQQLYEARKDGRICTIPYARGVEVQTFWDLGMDDSTTIWFMQQVGKELRFIDYYESSGKGLDHYAKVIKDKPYNYQEHYWPHDGAVRELGTGVSRKETAELMGIKPIIILDRPRNNYEVLADIEGGRNILSQCWFDEKRCAQGIAALQSYRTEYDEEKQTFGDKPEHTWASHGADGFRTFVRGMLPQVLRGLGKRSERKPVQMGQWTNKKEEPKDSGYFEIRVD